MYSVLCFGCELNVFCTIILNIAKMWSALCFCALIYLVQLVLILSSIYFLVIYRAERFVDLERKFEPSLLNSTVYLISMAMQVATVAVNYRVGDVVT